MTALLEAQDLTFEYLPGKPVLKDWSATFEAGTVTALTGPSGKGKSTLLYLFGLMLEPARGDILLQGVSTTAMTDYERSGHRATQYGFVFQDAALDPSRTVLDNVTEAALYRHESRKSVRMKAIELLEKFGVDVPAHRKPGQVSGGQASRIALCRALLTDPSVLLADEPTGNLDPATSQLVTQALIDHARQGHAVIVVTHSPELAAACDVELRL